MIALACPCGGLLTITDVPEGFGLEVDTLVDYFHDVHDGHGTGDGEPIRIAPHGGEPGGTV